MTQIPNVAEKTKEAIKRSSAYSLPNNPTGAGYKPQDIKNALFKPIVDGQYSVLAEVERLINELNKVLPSIQINRVELTEDDTLKIIDEKGETVTEIELPYNKKNDSVKDIELSCNREFKLSAKLKNEKGEEIATSNEIDLPIESLVVNATYYNGNIILELQNGNTIAFEVTDLINGLVNEDSLNSTLSDLTVYYDDKITNECDSVFNASKDYTDDKIANLNISGGSNITVEQQVNDSTNPVSSKAVKEVTDELKIKYKTLENSPEPFPLENNTVYIAREPITTLLVDLPTDINYICSLTFEVGKDYDIRLYRDDGEIMYLKPLDFESGELWEINIMNNIVASGKVSRKVVSE